MTQAQQWLQIAFSTSLGDVSLDGEFDKVDHDTCILALFQMCTKVLDRSSNEVKGLGAGIK